MTGLAETVEHEDPAGQMEQFTDPESEYEPGEHAIGADVELGHCQPAVQVRQAEAPPSEYCPLEQVTTVIRSEHAEPAGAAVQFVAPAAE